MKKAISIFGLWALAFAVVMPAAASGSELDISGFFDVTSTYQDSRGDRNEFGLGQAEVDIESELSEKAAIKVAVAYNNQTSGFELGEAEIDINLYSYESGPVSSVNIAAGLFDVPFGIDYWVYPSIDRKLVTAPLVVEMTHGCWNDFGFRLNVTSDVANLIVFGVNGFESSFDVIDQAQSLALGVPIGTEVNTTPANAFGGRLGFTPVEHLEVGGSFAVGLNESDKDEMVLMGGDFQYWISNFDFKGEYITHSLNRSITEEKNKGYYFQSVYDFGRTFLVGRYDSFKPDGVDWTTLYSLGAGYAVTNGVELRFETVIDSDNSTNNANILQLVAGF